MADQRVTELNPVVTPALTDILAVRQSGDTRDKRETVQQIIDLVPQQAQGLGNWRYRTETIEPPAAGQLRFDNTDISAATEFYISETNNSGPTDVSTFFDLLLVEGSVMFIQDLSNAANNALIELGAVTDEGTYRKVIITSIIENGTEPANNLPVLVILQAAPSGGGGASFPEYLFYADQMENPVNADWDLNSLAPVAADSNNAALSVRLYDDATAEGAGMSFKLPPGTSQFELEWVSRAETAPGGAAVVKPAIEIRTIGDDAAVPSPPWTSLNLTDTDIPTNENFQYDSQIITYASLSLAAGTYVQMQFNRNPTHPNDDLVGDWVLLSVLVSFT